MYKRQGKSGIVSAAVLGMQYQADIQKLCFLPGELTVKPHGRQYVLGKRHPVYRRMEKQAFVVIIALFYLIRVYHNGGNAGYQLYGLAHDIFQRIVVRKLVIEMCIRDSRFFLFFSLFSFRSSLFSQIVVSGEKIREKREEKRKGSIAPQSIELKN